jgi:hypothetical protein
LILGRHPNRLFELNVLANRGNGAFDDLTNRLFAVLHRERFGARVVMKENLGEFLSHVHEQLGFGDKIGLGLENDGTNRLVIVRNGKRDDAFAGCPIGSLGGGRLALFSKNLFGSLKVAAGLIEGRFAFHHRGIGFFSQSFDVLCCIGHVSFS